MNKKIEYEYGGSVVLGNVEWEWEHLKQVCHSDYVYEAKARGNICHKYKVPKEILNDWINSQNWEYDRKSHSQRPYSYRIDTAVNQLIKNASKLVEIQEEVNDIEFKDENLMSRIKIDIEVVDKGNSKKYKTFVLEKYSVLIEGIVEEYFGESHKMCEDETEIRYKTEMKDGEILIKYKQGR